MANLEVTTEVVEVIKGEAEMILTNIAETEVTLAKEVTTNNEEAIIAEAIKIIVEIVVGIITTVKTVVTKMIEKVATKIMASKEMDIKMIAPNGVDIKMIALIGVDIKMTALSEVDIKMTEEMAFKTVAATKMKITGEEEEIIEDVLILNRTGEKTLRLSEKNRLKNSSINSKMIEEVAEECQIIEVETKVDKSSFMIILKEI
jgi:hypothetical protein